MGVLKPSCGPKPSPTSPAVGPLYQQTRHHPPTGVREGGRGSIKAAAVAWPCVPMEGVGAAAEGGGGDKSVSEYGESLHIPTECAQWRKETAADAGPPLGAPAV